jgi:hypothetical protein
VHQESSLELSNLIEERRSHMHATFRRYEGVDRNRIDELSKKVNETLLPRLSKLPGFGGYYLIEGEGVMSSISVFETKEQADDSTRIASEWVREQNIEALLPNAPMVTSGAVLAHKTNGVLAAV